MLPTSRNTTYGANSPVLSADLDDIQDCIVDAKHGEIEFGHYATDFRSTQPYSPLRKISIPAVLATDNPQVTEGGTHTRALDGFILAASGVKVYYPLLLGVGDILHRYQITVVKNDTTNAVAAQLVEEKTGGGEAAIGTDPGDSTALVATDYILGAAIDWTVPAFDAGNRSTYYARITPGGTVAPAADRLGNVWMEVYQAGGAGSVFSDANGWSIHPLGDRLVSPIKAPVGDRITKCKFSYKRPAGGPFAITYDLARKDLATGAVTVIATATDNTTDGASIEQTLTAIDHTILADSEYALRVLFDFTGMGKDVAPTHAAELNLFGASHFRDRL